MKEKALTICLIRHNIKEDVMSNYSLVLYKKENGKVPIQEFYDELSVN